jgi:hypothetical protein
VNEDSWARHLAGDELDAEEERALVDAAGDPKVAARLLADLRLDGLLRNLDRDEGFETRLRLRYEHERSGEGFEARFRNEVSRRGGLRATLRYRTGARRSSVTTSPWLPWVAAAALVVGAITFAMRTASLSPEETAAARQKSAQRAQAEAEAFEDIARQVAERLRAEERRDALAREVAEREAARKEAELRREQDTLQKVEAAIARSRRELESAEEHLAWARAAESEAREALAPAPPPTLETVASIARIESVVGEARITGDRGGRAVPGAPLCPGQGIELGGSRSSLAFVYADGSRMELSPGTAVQNIRDTEQLGKSLTVLAGRLDAEITPQAAGRPLVLTTPHAEVRVLGTAIALQVGGATRVEVRHGRVKLLRPGSGGVDVAAGEAGIAAEGRDLAVVKLGLVERMIESNEGALAWAPFKADALDIALSGDQSAGGKRSVRLSYAWQDPGRGGKGWGGAGHAVRVLPGDQYLSFQVWIAQAEDTAKIGVISFLDDEGGWYMGNLRCEKCPKRTWFTFAIPLRGTPGKNNLKGGNAYDPERMTSFDITLGGGSSTVYVDEVVLTAERPPGARGPKR